MITFSKFGNHGNLGNHLHQLATLIGFSEKYTCNLILPPWKYSKYFEDPPLEGNIDAEIFIEEKKYHFTPEFWDEHAMEFQKKNVDILGWLQSEKYWEHCTEKVLKTLSFKKELVAKVKNKYSYAFKNEVIAISVRRGDFVTNPNFYLLPFEYYLKALLRYFPDYKKYNIIFFSDDLNYCKNNLPKMPNIYFAFGMNDIEQLALMSQCQHFIISNSSFSWWGAMLGEKEKSIIIRSPYQLAGKLLEEFNTKDYYPERWIVFDHLKNDIDIKVFAPSKLHLNFQKVKVKLHKISKAKTHIKTSKNN